MDLRETREDHDNAVDKLNAALQFNQKLEEYIGNPGEVVNKVRLFDENLARNPVLARRRVVESAVTHKEVRVNTIVEEVIRELAEEQSHTHRVETPQRPV